MPSLLRSSAVAAALAATTLAAGCTAPAVAPGTDTPPDVTPVTDLGQEGEEPTGGTEAEAAAGDALASVMAAEPRVVTGEHGQGLVPGVALVATADTLSYATTDGAHTSALAVLDGVAIDRVAVRPGSSPGNLVAAVAGHDDTSIGGMWWVRDQNGTVTIGQIPEMGTLGHFAPVWSPDGQELSWMLPPYEDRDGRLFSAPWSDAAGELGAVTHHEDVAVASHEALFDWRVTGDGDTRYARDLAYGGTVLYRRGPDGSIDVLAQPSDTVIAAVENRPSTPDDDRARPGGLGSGRVFVLDGPVTGPDAPAVLTLRASEAGPALDVPLGAVEDHPWFPRLAAGFDAVATITLVPGQERSVPTFAIVESSEQDGSVLVQHPWPFAEDVVDVAFLGPTSS